MTCEPRASPVTNGVRRNGSVTSSGAGKMPCVRKMQMGSSFPVYLPAMLCRRVAETETSCSLARVIHVDDFDGEALVHLGIQEEPAIVHGIGEAEVQRKVISPRAAL